MKMNFSLYIVLKIIKWYIKWFQGIFITFNKADCDQSNLVNKFEKLSATLNQERSKNENDILQKACSNLSGIKWCQKWNISITFNNDDKKVKCLSWRNKTKAFKWGIRLKTISNSIENTSPTTSWRKQNQHIINI